MPSCPPALPIRGICRFTRHYLRLPLITPQLRKPGQLHRNRAVLLQPRLVDRSLPSFVLVVGVQLDILAEPLYKAGLELVLRRPAADEVLGCLLVQVLQLHPLIARQVIREPRLSTLGLAPDPVAHDVPLVVVPLPLDDLPIGALAEVAWHHWRGGRPRPPPPDPPVQAPPRMRGIKARNKKR